MGSLATIVEAVKDELNGGSFSESFTATRAWVPVLELRDLSSLKITVTPSLSASPMRYEGLSRGSTKNYYRVQVYIQKKVEARSSLPEIDALLNLTEELAEFLTKRKIGDFGWVSTEIEQAYGPESLDEMGTFESVIVTEYTNV